MSRAVFSVTVSITGWTSPRALTRGFRFRCPIMPKRRRPAQSTEPATVSRLGDGSAQLGIDHPFTPAHHALEVERLVQHDQVGVLARFQGADAVVEAQQ